MRFCYKIYFTFINLGRSDANQQLRDFGTNTELTCDENPVEISVLQDITKKTVIDINTNPTTKRDAIACITGYIEYRENKKCKYANPKTIHKKMCN